MPHENFTRFIEKKIPPAELLHLVLTVTTTTLRNRMWNTKYPREPSEDKTLAKHPETELHRARVQS